MKVVICLALIFRDSLGFQSSLRQKQARNVLRMGYLDDLSPAQPDDENKYSPRIPPPLINPSSGVVPCGRGGLRSCLDEVTNPTNNNESQNDDPIHSDEPKAIAPKVSSWTNAYLSAFLTVDDPRTDIRNLLTQRSIQSFMHLLEECRDPHSAKWIQEDFLRTGSGLLNYHGTGAGFIEEFGGTWDGALVEMTRQPKERMIISAKRRGRGHGGWSKDNPYLEERWVEIPIDIDPANLVSRILSVREQIATEWVQDIDILVEANNQILASFFNTLKNRRGGHVGHVSNANNPSFERKAANMLNDISRASVDASTPFRRANFDLLYNLCTQAAIHRILREKKANGGDREVSFVFLRDYYTGRVEEYFDGELEYGRADDFIDELLQISPSVVSTGDGVTGLVDPVGAAESIIKMRNEVASEWKSLMYDVPKSHVGVQQALLASAMDRTSSSQQSTSGDDHAAFQ